MRGIAVAALAAAFLATLLLAGCRRQAGGDLSGEGPAGLEGCYSLEAGAEAAKPGGGAELPPAALPRMLELEDAVAGTVRTDGDSARPAYRAHSYLGTRRADHPLNRWTTLPGDSIRVDHSGALAGVVLRLSAADTVLSGIARGFTDVRAEDGGGSPTVPVRARRTACPGAGG